MTQLESGRDKVNEICRMIRNDTLQPAKDEAARIIAEAQAEADAIIAKANEDADDILQGLKKDLERQKSVYEATIELGIKQGIAKLRQLITGIFSDQLHQMINREMGKVDVMANIIKVLIEAIKCEGIDANIKVALAKGVDKEGLFEALSSKVKEKIEKDQIEIGDFKAGAAIKIVDKKISIEMTDKAVLELLSTYLSEDLRQKLFR